MRFSKVSYDLFQWAIFPPVLISPWRGCDIPRLKVAAFTCQRSRTSFVARRSTVHPPLFYIDMRMRLRNRLWRLRHNTGLVALNNDWSDEETDNPNLADDRNFYKVEKWTKDGLHVEAMIYAGNNLDKARNLFADAIKLRPRIRLTIRQRTRVLFQWPEE